MDGESELGAKMGGMDDAGTAVSSGYRARQPAKWGAITTLGSWACTGYNTKYVMCAVTVAKRLSCAEHRSKPVTHHHHASWSSRGGSEDLRTEQDPTRQGVGCGTVFFDNSCEATAHNWQVLYVPEINESKNQARLEHLAPSYPSSNVPGAPRGKLAGMVGCLPGASDPHPCNRQVDRWKIGCPRERCKREASAGLVSSSAVT